MASVLRFKAWRSRERCFNGFSSLKLHKYKIYQAGVFTDIVIKPLRYDPLHL
jgi:hypothetical protein